MQWTIIVAVLLAVIFVANGGYMLANPGDWYLAIDGVADTGPFNPHFVRDSGFIYLLTGLPWSLAFIFRTNGRACRG